MVVAVPAAVALLFDFRKNVAQTDFNVVGKLAAFFRLRPVVVDVAAISPRLAGFQIRDVANTDFAVNALPKFQEVKAVSVVRPAPVAVNAVRISDYHGVALLSVVAIMGEYFPPL